MAPEHVAPMVAFLAHEDCPVTGEIYAAGAGRFARLFIAVDARLRPPDAGADRRGRRRALGAINDEAGYTVPADLMEWSAGFLAHLLEADPIFPAPGRISASS